MIKNLWIQKIGTLLLLATLLAATGIELFAGAGIRPQKLTKWKRDANVSGHSMSSGFSLGMLDFTPRVLNGSSVAEPQPEGYLSIRGPLDLRFTGTLRKEFDRSKIEYVEHQGSFPKPPQPLPKPEPPVVTTPKPPAVVIPATASGTSSTPVMVDTTTPTLLQLLENAGGHQSKSAGALLFNKKVDGISPSGQEIYAPFVIPYDVNPPTVRLKTKATYIRE